MTTDPETAIKKGAELPLTIEGVSFGGQGVARIDDFVVFVNGAVPGDRVLARIVKKKKSFAEAVTVERLDASVCRTDAPCRHFGTCGGCRWMDVDYTAQLEFKRRTIEDLFARIGGLRDVQIPAPVPSPRVFAYRNKMEFTFGDRPWLTDITDGFSDEPGFALGLHVAKNFAKVLSIDRCHLQSELANSILRYVASFAQTSGLPAYSIRTNEGFWRFLILRQCARTSDLMVHVITTEQAAETMNGLRDELLDRFPEITSLVHSTSRRKSQVAVGEQEFLLAGRPIVTERLGRFEFEIAPSAFFQTNTLAAEKLYDTVLQLGAFDGTERVYDLYSGTGTIAIYLSGHVREVVGVEWAPEAVANAEKNARHNGVANCVFRQADIRQALAGCRDRPEVLILDPPRSGLHPDVVQSVLRLSPPSVLYVSCDPATQARDLALLTRDAYAVRRCQPVDMFPHTYHIENVVKLALR